MLLQAPPVPTENTSPGLGPKAQLRICISPLLPPSPQSVHTAVPLTVLLCELPGRPLRTCTPAPSVPSSLLLLPVSSDQNVFWNFLQPPELYEIQNLPQLCFSKRFPQETALRHLLSALSLMALSLLAVTL